MPRNKVRARWRFLLASTLVLAVGGTGLFLAWPRLFPSLVARAAAAYGRGDWSAATTLADAHLKAVPGDREALRILARTAVRQRRDRSAQALYGRLGGAEAMKAEDFYLFGTVIDRLGDRETARTCWEAGLHADPNYPELLHELAVISLRNRQLVQAAGLAKRLATRPGWEARGDLLLGRIAYEQSDPAGAIASLRRGLERDPEARNAPDTPAWYQKLLARALLRIGKPAEAVSLLQTLLKARPDPEASWLLSRAHLQSGAAAEASAAGKLGETYRDENPLEPEPAPYVGSARCAECHRTIHQSEQGSLHARTFQRAPELRNLPLPGHPLSDPARPEVRHTLERAGDQVRFGTQDRDTTFRALVDYAFGSDHRGVTLVGHDEKGRERELRLSHYSDVSAWDVTTGHPPQPPPREGFLGRFLSPDDVESCLYCHTTVPRSARERTGPESADRGIGCERCHGPGGNHVKAVAARFPDLAIASPGPASGAQVVALCAQCHGPFGKEVSRADPLAVRLPGTTLTWSRCYLESGGTFDCRTCHNPHRDAETSAAYYDAKCLSCHAAKPATSAGQPEGPRGAVCTVSQDRGCVSCHMPTVKTPIPHTRFTDHHIRIHTRPASAGKSQARAGAGD